MEKYKISLTPGPVRIPAAIRASYSEDFGSPDLEEEFFDLYRACEDDLQKILKTDNQIAILSGEGMLALWGALKSVIAPGDRVLAVASGIFGYGVAEMAKQIGARVEAVGFGYDEVLDADMVRDRARRFQPQVVTAIHCETPSGTLHPLADVGAVCQEIGALFYVDFVASAGGAPVHVDEWSIDLGLLGSQKVLSLMSDLSMVSISERAWERIHMCDYVGYDALAPWREGVDNRYLPYTHNWQAMHGLKVSLNMLLSEGMDTVFARHASCAAYCRASLRDLGVEIYPVDDSICSPTVTAAYVPPGWTWRELDEKLRSHGMVVGGNYGPLAEKVFRIGHMGSQADRELLEAGMGVLANVLETRPA